MTERVVGGTHAERRTFGESPLWEKPTKTIPEL